MSAQSQAPIPVSVVNLSLPVAMADAATAANQATDQALVGATNEAAPASDTAASGMNGRLQRVAQRLTSLIAGAPSIASGQVTAGAAATLVAARAARRCVTVLNTDALLSVYIGPATVTSGNGMLLKAGVQVRIETTALIQVLAASGSPVVTYMEEYDT